MAYTLNRVDIVGNLGQDPEVRTFANGGKVANLSVATSERWKDRQTGEIREKTEWHRVAIKNDFLADLAGRLRKGQTVMVTGRLETRKWQDQTGTDRYSTEIVVSGYTGTLIVPNIRLGDGPPAPSTGSPGRGAPDIDDEIPF